jgi:nitrite reductase/ring-hydroxylating ferredoxin subunit
VPAADTTWSLDDDALAPGQSARFRLRRPDGSLDGPLDGFVVNVGGVLHAYVNRCPHAGTALDLLREGFLGEDGRYIVCSRHGAVFTPETGVCVEGPCPGARLERLPISRAGRRVIVSCPT